MAVWDAFHELSKPDVQILTSDGLIPAHSSVLKSRSPVLKNKIEALCKHRSFGQIIPIFGVPCVAVEAFLRFLYSSRCTTEELNKFGIHLLALSHVYVVPQLKQMAVNAVCQFLVLENVVDMLQLAELCDAPDLYLRCMNYISNHLKAVETTEGWKVMQGHDPWIEMDILQFKDEVELRRKRARKQREAETAYMALSEAMECLEHIWTEGCTTVWPNGRPFNCGRTCCRKFSTCEGVQFLIKHFGTCKKRVNGGCIRCKRTWQLLRLHSSICDQVESCKVPLCRQLKLKMEQKKRGDNALWTMLVKKVVSAKAMSSLSLSHIKSKTQEDN